MKILITGGAGFVGSHLCDSLLSSGHDIVVFIRDNQKIQNISHIADKIIIENVDEYPSVFIRVTESKSLEDDVVHIMLDMPFPFAGRDYIIRYNKHKFDSEWTFNFSAVEHKDAPLIKSHVRLIHAAGEWKLTSINENETNVAYMWNGELRGDFPTWALSRAWIEQGNEMMEWLNDALHN